MCKPCNGGRDRDMDAAYELFSEYLWDHQDDLLDCSAFDWRWVYGHDWLEGSRNLAAYYGKQLGCMLAQQRLPVPDVLRTFLDDPNSTPADLGFTVFEDPGQKMFHRLAREDGIDARGYGNPESFVTLTPDSRTLHATSLERLIGHSGISVTYERGAGPCENFFDRPVTPIRQITTGATPEEVRALLRPDTPKEG